MNSYYFIDKVPVKMTANRVADTISFDGTGWLYCNWSDFVKPKLVQNSGKWQVVESATQEDIIEMTKQKQLDQIDMLNEQWEADGKVYQRKIKNKVTAALIGKGNAVDIMKEINKTVYPMLNKIAKGDWALAMLDYLDGENQPSIQEVIDLFNEVGQKAVDYYTNEYPH